MLKIFISYRRQDSDAVSGRIRDWLASRYGKSAIFMDVDNIPFGTDFRKYLQDELDKSNIVLAIIGSNWLTATKDGVRCLDDENDLVRVELETALHASVPIIPVLIGNALMPSLRDLPESLKGFADINAAPVDPGRDFAPHMDRLIRAIDELLGNLKKFSTGHSDESSETARPQLKEGAIHTGIDRMKLSPFAALGGFIPFVVKLYNEIDQVPFIFQTKYAISIFLFSGISAVVGAIFPYRSATPWKALLTGLSFTMVLGIIAALARAAPTGGWLGGGSNASISWLELISIF
jgi:hypothetical protein